MNNALEAYRGLLRELDKWESPTFTVGDFNYFYDSAKDEYIANNYAIFDVKQKSLDDISAIVKLEEPLTFISNEVNVPIKYRHILSLELMLKFVVAVDGYAVNDTIKVYPKRMRTNRKGFSAKNAYQQESYSEPYFQIAKGKLKILCGNEVTVTTGKIDYIEIPDKVYLNPDKSVDFSDPQNNTPLQFPEYVNVEIVKHCALLFLENIQSQRYQTSLNQSVLRKE